MLALLWAFSTFAPLSYAQKAPKGKPKEQKAIPHMRVKARKAPPATRKAILTPKQMERDIKARRKAYLARQVKKKKRPLSSMGLPLLIETCESRDWKEQNALIEEFIRRIKIKKGGRQILESLLLTLQSHKHVRVRLVISHVFARLGDTRALPILIAFADRWFDQPTPLLAGAFLEYGDKASYQFWGVYL